MNEQIYIKFSNGSTTQLVDLYNEERQAEVIEDGFIMVTDEEGMPETVSSSEIITEVHLERADMLRKIKERHEAKNEVLKAQAKYAAQRRG